MSDERTEALQQLLTAVISALGDEKAKPFEIDAYYEFVETESYSQDEICPRVRLVKR